MKACIRTTTAATAVSAALMAHAAAMPSDNPDQPAPAGDSTIVLWSCDEGDGAELKDSAAPELDGENNGVFAGDGLRWTDGKFGGGLALGGVRSHVGAKIDGQLISDTQQASMAAWIKPSKPQQATYILALGDGAVGFLRFNVDGRLNAGFMTSMDWVEAAGGETSDWYVGEWNHVAATFDRGTVSLYLNGDLVDAQTKPGAVFGTPGGFYFGAVPWELADESKYQGEIDDVRLGNAAGL